MLHGRVAAAERPLDTVPGMRRLIARLVIGCLALLGACAQAQVDDARRFAQVLIAADGHPDAAALEAGYLQPASAGLRAFVPDYIGDAERLAEAVGQAPAAYRHAVAVCLPDADAVDAVMEDVLARYRARMPVPSRPAVHLLFGANSSAGTTGAGAIFIGLEKACEGVADAAAFRTRLQGLLAHELVDLLQPPMADAARRDLLSWALREGTASMVSALVLGQPYTGAQDAWAMSREAMLWPRFQQDRQAMLQHWPEGGEPDPQAVAAGTRWFWNTGTPEGWPGDLGYWVGQRIVAQWYQRHGQAPGALAQLVTSRTPAQVLAESGYAPDRDAPAAAADRQARTAAAAPASP
jgi:hypothetical protein